MASGVENEGPRYFGRSSSSRMQLSSTIRKFSPFHESKNKKTNPCCMISLNQRNVSKTGFSPVSSEGGVSLDSEGGGDSSSSIGVGVAGIVKSSRPSSPPLCLSIFKVYQLIGNFCNPVSLVKKGGLSALIREKKQKVLTRLIWIVALLFGLADCLFHWVILRGFWRSIRMALLGALLRSPLPFDEW